MHRTNPLSSLIRIALVGLTLAICAASVDAAPKHRPPAVELTDTEEAAARAEIAKAKADGKRARSRLKLLKAQRSATKAQKRADKAKARTAKLVSLQVCLDGHADLDDEDAMAACTPE